MELVKINCFVVVVVVVAQIYRSSLLLKFIDLVQIENWKVFVRSLVSGSNYSCSSLL